MSGWLAGIATAAAGLFAGAAVYVSLVEHPARLACGPLVAVAQFRLSSPRAGALQVPLAVVGCVASAGAWLAGAAAVWLATGVLLGLTVPYTRAVLGPTGRRLLDRTLEPDTPEAERLLRRWSYLHLGRTLLGLAALALMLHALAGP